MVSQQPSVGREAVAVNNKPHNREGQEGWRCPYGVEVVEQEEQEEEEEEEVKEDEEGERESGKVGK